MRRKICRASGPGRSPRGTRDPASTRRTSVLQRGAAALGYGSCPLERFGELLELDLALDRDLEAAGVTRAENPVSRSAARRHAPLARVGRRLRAGASPSAGPARLPLRRTHREPLADDLAGEPAPSLLSGTANTARAWPSVSSPRSTIDARMSSESSSSRTRFETAGLRVADALGDLLQRQAELLDQQRVGLRLLDRPSSSRARFSTSASSRSSRSSASRTTPARRPARRARHASGARRRSSVAPVPSGAGGRAAGRFPGRGWSRRGPRSPRRSAARLAPVGADQLDRQL